MYKLPDGFVEWCPVCEATGRIVLCRASDGYYAVAEYAVARFQAGELHPKTSGVVFYLGEQAPTRFRYPEPSRRIPVDPGDVPWSVEDASSKPDRS